jgi:glucokinase
MEWIIGVDIGGTNCVVGAVAVDGSRVAGEITRPTLPARGADAVINDLAEMVQDAASQVQRHEDGNVLGVGVGAPGPLNIRDGVVLLTPNLGWTNLPLRNRIATATGLPTTLDNDANCAVQAECWVGAARGAHHAIGLTLGTGIGGGIVIGGTPYHGASDAAAEFGHMVIDPAGPLCGCGNRGCLEALASGLSIARRGAAGWDREDAATLRRLARGNRAVVTAELIYQAAAAGDRFSDSVIGETARYLAIGVANLINIFNPDVVVVLGGVARAGDALFVPLQREVAARAFPSAVGACRIVPGALGHLAGVYGAAHAFLTQRAARPS